MNNENKIINESILDPIQNQRCEALFNPNDQNEQPVILQSTKDFIFGLLEKFKKETKLKFEYTQAFIVGSSLGYQYKDTSDIDVDVRIDIPREKMKGKFHCIPKNIMLPGTSHPINVFLMTADDPEFDFDTFAENAYDLLTDTWIKQGRLENSDVIPYEHVAGISEFIMDGMALELHRGERDMYELQKYLNIDPRKSAITDNERKEAISRKIGDLLIDKDALRLAHSMVLRLERGGFDWNMPFDISIKYVYQDKHYSMNNIIYKYVDQFGYYEKIDEMVKQITELIKTAKKALTEVTEETPETINQAAAQQEVIDEIGGFSQARNEKMAQEQAVEETEVEPEEYQAAGKAKQQTKDPVDVNEEEPVANIAEAYSDETLKEILVENGFAPSEKNIFMIKDQDYIIVEDLTSKMENHINRKIFKASGNKSQIASQALGFLFAGPLGFEIANDLWQQNSEERNDKTRELHSLIASDDNCQDLIYEIKNELKSENPDKSKLKKLKHQFDQAVDRCKKNAKAERQSYDNPRISLREAK